VSDITLPRAVAEKLRKALFDWAECHNDVADFCDDDKEILAALEAALAEPTAKPEPVVVEQLFALAKLTVRRAADPDPWVWDRLSDDGTWTPFNPLIHGPDMWRLEQALRAALAEPMAEQHPEKGPALSAYNEIAATDDPGSPLERLRFFCSLAMRPQDWLDVKPFFDALAEPQPEPVAWMYVNLEGECEQIEYGTPSIDDDSITLLYAAPPEPDAKREPATMQQIVATHHTTYGAPWLDQFDRAWKAAERFHGIGGSKT